MSSSKGHNTKIWGNLEDSLLKVIYNYGKMKSDQYRGIDKQAATLPFIMKITVNYVAIWTILRMQCEVKKAEPQIAGSR